MNRNPVRIRSIMAGANGIELENEYNNFIAKPGSAVPSKITRTQTMFSLLPSVTLSNNHGNIDDKGNARDGTGAGAIPDGKRANKGEGKGKGKQGQQPGLGMGPAYGAFGGQNNNQQQPEGKGKGKQGQEKGQAGVATMMNCKEHPCSSTLFPHDHPNGFQRPVWNQLTNNGAKPLPASCSSGNANPQLKMRGGHFWITLFECKDVPNEKILDKHKKWCPGNSCRMKRPNPRDADGVHWWAEPGRFRGIVLDADPSMYPEQ